MKVIDLLNKIANGEEVPKAIMYDGDIWKYDELSNDYEMFEESGDLYLFQEELYITRALNDEIEIIEEKEDMNLVKINTDYFYSLSAEERDGLLKEKINEIIDYINKENK